MSIIEEVSHVGKDVVDAHIEIRAVWNEAKQVHILSEALRTGIDLKKEAGLVPGWLLDTPTGLGGQAMECRGNAALAHRVHADLLCAGVYPRLPG